MIPTPVECAAELLETVPLIMRAVRMEVRRDRTPELSMPQFRALAFVGRKEGGTLTEVAAFLGLTLPTASKMMDGLVDAGFVVRDPDRNDRRKLRLNLSAAGRQKYEDIQYHAREYLADRVRHLGDQDREQVTASLRLLRDAFENDHPALVPASASHFQGPSTSSASPQQVLTEPRERWPLSAASLSRREGEPQTSTES